MQAALAKGWLVLLAFILSPRNVIGKKRNESVLHVFYFAEYTDVELTQRDAARGLLNVGYH